MFQLFNRGIQKLISYDNFAELFEDYWRKQPITNQFLEDIYIVGEQNQNQLQTVLGNNQVFTIGDLLLIFMKVKLK